MSVRTNLVLVPVIVTDKKGNHIEGLKAEDFEIKEEGSAQKILKLDELTTDTVKIEKPAQDANNFTNQMMVDHPKKLEIIVLDQINTRFASTADAHRGLINFLSRGVDSNTLLALVALQRNGIRVIHNFTSDPSVLSEALKKVQINLTARDTQTQDNLGDTSPADIEANMLQALLSNTDVGGGSANELAAAMRASRAQANARIDSSRQNQEALVTLECFQEIAQYFSGVPGRKSLIWASTAFPFSLGSTPGEVSRGTTFDDWERTFHMLQDANIAVYPVDVGGLGEVGTANTLQTLNSGAISTGGGEGGVGVRRGQLDAVSNGSLIDPTIGRQQTMRNLADMTGGQAFYNNNDLSGLFRRAGEDSAQYYMIAYSTSNSGKPGWRKLSVKVRADGAKVRTRAGYYYNPNGGMSEQTRQADELMAMVSDLNFASVPMRGQWSHIEPVGDQRKVRFMLSIPAGVPMIDADHQHHISMDFRIVAKDATGKAVANIAQKMETNLAADDANTIETKGLDYANEFTLPPGQYKVHFVVRDNLRGTLGSIVTPLQIQ